MLHGKNIVPIPKCFIVCLIKARVQTTGSASANVAILSHFLFTGSVFFDVFPNAAMSSLRILIFRKFLSI